MTARRPLVSANWKMNLNHFEAIQVIQKLAFALKSDVYDTVDVSIHAPFTDLRTVQTLLESDRIPMTLGAQHCYWEDSGAFTGEISPSMLAKLNVRYVLAGHSERRQLFGDSNEQVNKRVLAIRKQQMTPILCVGETLEEREQGFTLDKIKGQLLAGFEGLPAAAIGEMVIAYEPIWAIGTGRTATADDAQVACAYLREVVGEKWNAGAADAVRIQYGGSVKAVNAGELMARDDIDGLLVGGASLDPDEFARIISAVAFPESF